MRALWLIPPVVMPFASGAAPEQALLTCALASARLRIAVAALEWKRCGNENVFLDPGVTGAGQRIDWNSAKICVVPKYYYDVPLQPWLDACLTAKRSGCRLVIDVCDFPFKKPPPVPAFYSEALRICDAVVVNSERMAELMAPYASRRAVVIEDAILGAQGNPRFSPDTRLELLWFGHPTNLHFLRGCLESLIAFGTQRRCRLTVVTMEGYGAEQLTQEIESLFAPAFEARFIQWTLEATKMALHDCDLVLLPSDPSDPFKAGASANRVAEALNAGRFPIASPLPSYLPFSDSAWLGLDLVEGIKWTHENRGEVLARIQRGQVLVAEKFAADKVGRQWCELFDSLVSLPGR